MIDADGYPVLVDFGCSKHCPDKTFTFVGTPNYVAPEIITNAGHNRCVDYWALGITVYEMLTGENPFFFDGMDPVTLYHAICNEKYYPLSGHSAELVDLMDRLLEKNPAQRLGMLANGVDDFFDHPWFEGMDLVRIRSKEWIAPWRAPKGEDKDSEESVLRKMGMYIRTPSLDDSMTSRDVINTDDSTVSLADTSDRDHSMRSIEEKEDDSMVSLLDEESKPTKSDKKKKGKKIKNSNGTKNKKRVTDVTSEYRFVTPTKVTYYNIEKKKTRNAKEKAESESRRSALKGTLRNLGVDSDDDEDDFSQFLLLGKK